MHDLLYFGKRVCEACAEDFKGYTIRIWHGMKSLDRHETKQYFTPIPSRLDVDDIVIRWTLTHREPGHIDIGVVALQQQAASQVLR